MGKDRQGHGDRSWHGGAISVGVAAGLAGLVVLAGATSCTSDCDLNLTCDKYREACGNGVVEPGEECDSGADNSDSAPDACRATCVKASCGDGVIDAGEVCDGDSGDPHAVCAPTCTAVGCIVGTPPYPTIQSAVDDAMCAVVVVPAGTYMENVTVGRDVQIVGVGADTPVIHGGGGGSVIVISSGNVTLNHLVVTGGKAIEGGGIHNEGTLTLDGCAIQENAVTGADAKGGGVYTKGWLTAKATTIAKNHAPNGGGIYNAGAVVDVSASEITGNIVDDVSAEMPVNQVAGGGIYSDGGTIFLSHATQVSGNAVKATATEANPTFASDLYVYALGGGIYSTGSEITIDASDVWKNTVDATLAIDPNTQVDFLQIIASAYGAGLVAEMSTVILTNKATVSGNTVTSSFASAPDKVIPPAAYAYGGGIWASSTSILLKEGSAVSQNNAIGSVLGNPGSLPNNFLWGAIGGGIDALGGTIDVEDSSLEGNLAEGSTGSGGAVRLSASSSLLIRRSALRGNAAHGMVAGASGGAVSAYDALVEVEDSIIEHNEARGADTKGSASGGAFSLSSGTGDDLMKLTLRRSTVSENTALGAMVSGGSATGGAIDGDSGTGEAHTIIEIVDSTVSGNVAKGSPVPDGTARGGAIALSSGTGSSVSSLVLRSATITANRAEGMTSEAGGIRLALGSSMAVTSASFANSIVASNQASVSPDCLTVSVTISSDGNNIVGNTEGCTIGGSGTLTGIDPMLLPFGDYGGPTPTHALPANSPAVDAGSACVDEIGIQLTVDQRGHPRNQGICDLGAFERQADDP